MTLKGYGKPITNIFRLLGDKENDITKSISYLFYVSRSFLSSFLDYCGVIGDDVNVEDISICYQERNMNGITDIEIVKNDEFRIVIEAKVSYKLPSEEQLKRYADDLLRSRERKYIFTLSNLSRKTAEGLLVKSIDEIPVGHIPYMDILDLANVSLKTAKGEEKQFLKHFVRYLREVIDMKDKHSNSVFVTPITGESIREHDELKQYHCPVGGQGFPKEPPNYIGFRHGSKLQCINFVEKYECYKNEGRLFFRFYLGPDIIPPEKIHAGGKIRSAKFYCDIDLLLTCKTILEAKDKTKERHREQPLPKGR